MEKDKELRKLLTKLVDNSISEKEYNRLLELIELVEDNGAIEDKILEISTSTDTKGLDEYDHMVLDRVDQHVHRYIGKENTRSRTILWPTYAAVAAVLIAVVGGFYHFYQNKPITLDKRNTWTIAKETAHKIATPPHADVELIATDRRIPLSDLKIGDTLSATGFNLIKLSENAILYHAVKEYPTVADAFNILQVPRGNRYEIHFDDGTRIWLNAESKLRFPSTFVGKKHREVYLIGEGYFEIAKNKEQPFRVITDQMERREDIGQIIEVLGTRFNVSAYPAQKIKTTLMEGRIALSNLSRKNTRILTPGDQAVMTGNGVEVHATDTEKSLDWKNGKFVFDGENIEAIMLKISRWYDIDYSIMPGVAAENFNGTMPRSATLREILDVMSSTGLIHYQIEGRRVIIMP